MEKNFKLWVLQSTQDLEKYKKELEQQAEEAARPYRVQIQRVERLINAMKEDGAPQQMPLWQEPKVHKGAAAKGFRYEGTHWTQDPNRKAQLREAIQKGIQTRRGYRA
jgi:DNA repair photolyase